jgi:hypothetical protein
MNKRYKPDEMAKIEIEILIFSSYAIGYAPPILETSIKE